MDIFNILVRGQWTDQWTPIERSLDMVIVHNVTNVHNGVMDTPNRSCCTFTEKGPHYCIEIAAIINEIIQDCLLGYEHSDKL